MLLAWMGGCMNEPGLLDWMLVPRQVHYHRWKKTTWHMWMGQWCHLCLPEMWHCYCSCHDMCFLVVCLVFLCLPPFRHIVAAHFPAQWLRLSYRISWVAVAGSIWLVLASEFRVWNDVWHIQARACNYSGEGWGSLESPCPPCMVTGNSQRVSSVSKK